MSYLSEKISKKVDELMKENPRLDMESLKRTLPNKMRLTRQDIPSIMRELEKEGRFIITKGKVTRRKK